MWLMLQQEKPDEYVIATNETHSIREFLDAAFGHVGLDWKKYVEIDPRYYRPAEVELLIGDSSKARRKLGWEPKTKFVDLVRLMVDADIKLLKDHREGRIKVAGLGANQKRMTKVKRRKKTQRSKNQNKKDNKNEQRTRREINQKKK